MGVRRHRGAALLLQVVMPVLLVMQVLPSAVEAFAPSSWNAAHATYYGGADASGTQGVCLISLQLLLTSFNSKQMLRVDDVRALLELMNAYIEGVFLT